MTQIPVRDDNEEPQVADIQAPQDGSTDKELDTPNADQSPDGQASSADQPSTVEQQLAVAGSNASENQTAAPADQPVSNQDDQETDNPDASHKPGEAQGRTTSEIKAAEEAPETAKRTNPVAEATGKESKDPYAEGKHITNPEPNNGQGVKDSELNPTEREDSEPSADER